MSRMSLQSAAPASNPPCQGQDSRFPGPDLQSRNKYSRILQVIQAIWNDTIMMDPRSQIPNQCARCIGIDIRDLFCSRLTVREDHLIAAGNHSKQRRLDKIDFRESRRENSLSTAARGVTRDKNAGTNLLSVPH